MVDEALILRKLSELAFIKYKDAIIRLLEADKAGSQS
jgi:hypothetical protein